MDRSKGRAARTLVVTLLTVGLAVVAIAPPAQASWLTDLLGLTPPTATASDASPPTTSSWLTCLLGGCPATTTTTTTTTTTLPASTTTSTVPATTTVPTTTTSTTPPTAGCGDLPKAGGGTWVCSFDDEFNGTTLDRTKWTPQLTSQNSFDKGLECFVDSPDNISVSDGSLHLTVRQEAAPFSCAGLHQSSYTSGMVSTIPGSGTGHAQTNGRFEIRAKVTGAKVKGLQESIWMWPVTPVGFWPYSGEIDIAEIYHNHPDRAIPYVHYSYTGDPNATNDYCMINDISQFHTYVLEWTPQSLRISYDGKVCIDDAWTPWLPQTGRQPFDQPFYLVLTQALGIGDNAFDPATTPLPASTVVDYVRMWQ